LLPGETAQFNNEVSFICPYFGPQWGTLTITNYQLHFISNPLDDREPVQQFFMPLGVVSRIEKVGGVNSRRENSYGIEVQCKDMRNLRFAYKQKGHSRRTVFEKLQTLAFPLTHKEQLFAFACEKKKMNEDGWNIFDPIAEFSRMGLVSSISFFNEAKF
jgi:myotubularin-related protein 1/2